jgi:rhamnosyltransferase
MELPFDNDILIAEDQQWAGKMINRGFKIVYEPISMVCHSHNYSPRQMADIKFKIGMATGRFKSKSSALVLGFFLMLGGIIVKVIGDFGFIFLSYKPANPIPFSKKIKEFSTGFKARTAGFWGRYRGWIYR